MRGSARPSKPALPEERPRLPKDVYNDVRASATASDADDVARALGAADEALTEGRVDAVVELLEWAKAAAARSWAVREGLGVAYYLSGRYRDAHRELLTYRRLSGRQDQNHLLADCARAIGDTEKVPAYVDAMVAAGVDAERVAEGRLVLAGERADRGDLDGALTALSGVVVHDDDVGPHHLRVWFLEAQLRERRGEHERAQGLREAICAVDPEWLEMMGSDTG